MEGVAVIAAERVALVRGPDGKVWHILRETQRGTSKNGEVLVHAGDFALCGWPIPSTPAAISVEIGVDAHVVQHRGKPVCANCRGKLK